MENTGVGHEVAETESDAIVMTSGSHYDTLGVPPDATPAEVREAFTRRLAVSHLDRRASYAQRLAAVEAVAALRLAYLTLADPQRRAEYDWRLGIDDLQPLDWGGAMPEPSPVEAPVLAGPSRWLRPPLTPREWLCALRLVHHRLIAATRSAPWR
jgi:curved DNA-binding protein CbpA